MKRATVAAVFLSVVWGGYALGEPLGFTRVSGHCYYLQLSPGGQNVGAVVTDEGVLLLDPPPEFDLPAAVDALKKLTVKPVRWIMFSNPRSAVSAEARFFVEQGAVLLAGAQLRSLAASISGAGREGKTESGAGSGLSSFPWLVFDREMHLFPSGLEIRIIQLQHKAQTGGDVVAYVPAERVLFAGGLFGAAAYPDIDTSAQGSAAGWIDGLKQVVDAIPVLKQAIPQAKPDPKEAEKTLEEGIAVVSFRGEVSNLQNVKDLLGASQKLRADMVKALKSGRSCENFLNSARAGAYRVYSNFDNFAGQLCQELQD